MYSIGIRLEQILSSMDIRSVTIRKYSQYMADGSNEYTLHQLIFIKSKGKDDSPEFI